ALGEAYRGLLLTGRYPIAFLRLRMPPDMVDVNVHPTKLEVRFQDSGRIYSQMLGTLRTQFLSSDLTATYGATGETADATPKAHDSGSAQALRNELVAWAKGAVPEDSENRGASGSGSPAGKSQTDFELDFRSPRYPPLELTNFNRDEVLSRDSDNRGKPFAGQEPGTTHRIDPAQAGEGSQSGPPRHGVGREQRGIQLHNRYLIAETDEGMVIIDQHALHERILYEEIREKVLAQRLETQRLLVPETLNLSPAEYAAVEGAVELFQKIGIELEPFGGDTFLVRGYPAMLDRKRPQEIVREMIDHLLEGGKQPDSRDLLDDLLHMMSCKAAVKAGDRLSTEEIDALLELRHLCQDAHHCPHGRPTALVFTNEELDRRFQRI
ncbi:MAG: DNA mismatch repair protein MutL, partial [Pirellulaceae bacterium]